jgi:methionyl-tRNA formyltransferase
MSDPASARIVFMGTSAFAVPSLHALVREGYRVDAVVTQPARPAGRSRRLTPPPAMAAAEALGLRVLSPERLRAPEVVAAISELRPDLIVVAAYGQLLPRTILDLPPHGCVNVHGSLLPRWRGASPIQSAILAGDEFTGVGIMLMEPTMDTGPLIAQSRTRIEDEDTSLELEGRLARAGAAALVSVLPLHLMAGASAVPQVDELATYAPILRKEQGLIDWRTPAIEIWRACRAFRPWPGTSTAWRGKMLKVVSCRPEELHLPEEPGTVVSLDGGRAVGVVTGGGTLRLEDLAPEGGRTMSVREFVAGHRDFVGGKLG